MALRRSSQSDPLFCGNVLEVTDTLSDRNGVISAENSEKVSPLRILSQASGIYMMVPWALQDDMKVRQSGSCNSQNFATFVIVRSGYLSRSSLSKADNGNLTTTPLPNPEDNVTSHEFGSLVDAMASMLKSFWANFLVFFLSPL